MKQKQANKENEIYKKHNNILNQTKTQTKNKNKKKHQQQ